MPGSDMAEPGGDEAAKAVPDPDYVGAIRLGTWVRFYRDGHLVIGQVEYTGRDDATGIEVLATDAGPVRKDFVLESR